VSGPLLDRIDLHVEVPRVAVASLGEEGPDGELALLGNVELATAEHWQGRYGSAVPHFDAGYELYAAQRRRAVASQLRGETVALPLSYLDMGVVALGLGGWALWTIGWPDRGLARARAAVTLARELQDPFNLAFALTVEAVTHSLRRDLTAQGERAREAMALSEANGFPLFLGVGRCSTDRHAPCPATAWRWKTSSRGWL
jgi:hypothetical protein